jgi:dTDP-4-amino-4,6-dideoxygalactose transaminase
VYHLFVVRAHERDALQAHLAASGIETLIHYPIPLSRQPAFTQLAGRNVATPPAAAPAGCPAAERAADEILSLPLHPRLADTDVERICAAVELFLTAPIN